MDIFKVEEIAGEIANFKDCYSDIQLWGQRDGPVTAGVLIQWLMDNPHMDQIAQSIAKINAQ